MRKASNEQLHRLSHVEHGIFRSRARARSALLPPHRSIVVPGHARIPSEPPRWKLRAKSARKEPPPEYLIPSTIDPRFVPARFISETLPDRYPGKVGERGARARTSGATGSRRRIKAPGSQTCKLQDSPQPGPLITHVSAISHPPSPCALLTSRVVGCGSIRVSRRASAYGFRGSAARPPSRCPMYRTSWCLLSP